MKLEAFGTLSGVDIVSDGISLAIDSLDYRSAYRPVADSLRLKVYGDPQELKVWGEHIGELVKVSVDTEVEGNASPAEPDDVE